MRMSTSAYHMYGVLMHTYRQLLSQLLPTASAYNTQMDTQRMLSLSLSLRYLFVKLVPTISDPSALSQVVLQPISLNSHILLQWNRLIHNSFLLLEVTCFHLLQYAKGEKKTNQGEIGLFSKTEETALKKDVRKSAQLMIHSHISQYSVKTNNDNFCSLWISGTSSIHQCVFLPFLFACFLPALFYLQSSTPVNLCLLNKLEERNKSSTQRSCR